MIVVFFQHRLKEKLPIILINTLLLQIPLLALMDKQNEGRRDKYTRCVWGGGTIFPVVPLCQFLVMAGNRFWLYLCTQSTMQLWCFVSFLVLVGNSFWYYVCTQCTIQLCGCVSFLVVAENSSQNANMFLQKSLIGLLHYDPLADVCISCDLTLFYSVLFFFVYFSCTMQVHILKFKSEYYIKINIGNQVNMQTLAITL